MEFMTTAKMEAQKDDFMCPKDNRFRVDKVIPTKKGAVFWPTL